MAAPLGAGGIRPSTASTVLRSVRIWFCRSFCDLLLQAGVDVEHHGVADLGRGRAERPHDVAAGVDREGLAAGHAPQVRLVLRLDARQADLAALGVAVVGVGGQVARRDGAHVAEDLASRSSRPGGSVRWATVSTLTPGYSDWCVWRYCTVAVDTPVATGTGSYGLYWTLLTDACTCFGVSPDQRRHHADDARVLRRLGAREQDLLLRSVRHQHGAVAVDDLAARRRDADHPHLVARHRGGVGLALDHLERPQPQDEDAEEEEHDDADDRAAAGSAATPPPRASRRCDATLTLLRGRMRGWRRVGAPRAAARRAASRAWGGAGRRGSGGGGSASPEPAVGLRRDERAAVALPGQGPPHQPADREHQHHARDADDEEEARKSICTICSWPRIAPSTANSMSAATLPASAATGLSQAARGSTAVVSAPTE